VKSVLLAVLALAASGVSLADEALPLTAPEVRTEVEKVVYRLGEMFTSLDGPQPIELFDRSEPAIQYLGEEMDDWMIGWDALEWYFNTPERFAMVEAMDYHPSNIRVRSLTPELALATWDIHAEMKFRRGPPMGERLRANAILRDTSEGWRFIYYAESAKSTLAYINDLYEAMATPEFRERFAEEADGGASLTSPPSSQ